jgi:hypothetical protein
MNQLSYNNNTFIQGDYVLEQAPIFSKGCRSARDLVKKKNIKPSEYIFARLKGNEWMVTDGKSPKYDKVFLQKTIIDNIPELNNDNDNAIADINGIMKAPNIIYLKKEEQFCDNDGNIIDIETRGVREHDKIYFKVKDIAIGFGLPNLQDTLIHKNTKYENNTDYKYFLCQIPEDIRKKTSKNKDDKQSIKKELFLTYEGMLRVLFCSENNKTSHFIKWATKTLFTAQMGTTEQKNEMVAQIKGVSYSAIQELFSINARELPCVYLTAFNRVDKLRKTMNIDKQYADDSIIYKFGLTKSFGTRKNGHKSEYKNIENLIDMKLVYFSYIDPLYVSEAETEIKNLLTDYKIEWDNHDELVVIPNNMMKIVKTIYENIGMKYSGHTAEFNKKINELNNEINRLQTQEVYLIKEYEYKLAIKDQIISNKDKDIEILNLRLLLAQK